MMAAFAQTMSFALAGGLALSGGLLAAALF
jgi:hypothetical protein